MERNHDFEFEFERLDIEYCALEPARQAVREKAVDPYQKALSYNNGIDQSRTQYETDERRRRE